MKVSLVFYPNKDKKSKRTGKTPMYARMCLKGLKAEERLTVQVNDEDLLKWNPKGMRFSDRNNSVNRLLNSLDQKFDEFIILNSSSLYQFKPRKVLDHVLGKPEDEETTIAEVSFKVRFSSQAYFSTVFKSKFSCTPSEYNEKFKNADT